jgi:cytoskeletal protein RodZ
VSFGRDLQAERLRREVSLESVSEGTKVSVKYLRALESGNHAQLPGGVFNRGIVQSYCRYLALDEEQWLGRWAEFSRPAEAAPDWSEFAQNVKRSRASMSPRMRLRWWGVLLMLLALAGLGWAAWHYVVKPRGWVRTNPAATSGLGDLRGIPGSKAQRLNPT